MFLKLNVTPEPQNLDHFDMYNYSRDYYSSCVIFLFKHIEMKCLMPTFSTKCPTTLFDFLMVSYAFKINHSFNTYIWYVLTCSKRTRTFIADFKLVLTNLKSQFRKLH